MTTTQSTSGEPQHEDVQELQGRLRALEHQVRTLTVALDAASRLRISTSLRVDEDLRIAGGKTVRRILADSGLIDGYPEVPGSE
jgi:hypothetical protein